MSETPTHELTPLQKCSRAKSDMTPCIIRDGWDAADDAGVCVGCGWKPASRAEVRRLQFGVAEREKSAAPDSRTAPPECGNCGHAEHANAPCDAALCGCTESTFYRRAPSSETGTGPTLDVGEGQTWLTNEQELARELNGALIVLCDPTSAERHERAAADRVKRLFNRFQRALSISQSRIAELEAELGRCRRDESGGTESS